MEVIISIAVILIASAIIYYIGQFFAESSSKIGDYLEMPRSVKGATFDAISSSMPELMIAVFSLIFFKRFDVGIGTIAGSALFNLLIIPGIAVLVAPVTFKVSKELLTRDGIFYTIAVFALLSALFYSKVWGLAIPLIFLFLYLLYIRLIIRHTKKHTLTARQKKIAKKIRIQKELLIAGISVLVMGVAAFYLTESSINLAEAIGIPPVIIAFTIIAAATSVPDAVISITNARKGQLDDATSNVFGSNIFDILIGLSIPVLLAYFMLGPVEIIFDQVAIILGLLGATILMLYFLAEDYTLHKRHALFLLILYAAFVFYVIRIY